MFYEIILLVKFIVMLLVIFINYSVFSFEKCGYYDVFGEFTCVKESCFLVSQPSTLSEKYIKISNSDKITKFQHSIPLKTKMKISKMLNSKQFIGKLIQVEILKKTHTTVAQNNPLLIQELNCD